MGALQIINLAFRYNAIQIFHNNVLHKCTEHSEIHCHFVHHETLCLSLFASSNKPANVFIKAYLPGYFCNIVSKLKLASTILPT